MCDVLPQAEPLLVPANAADLLHTLTGWVHNGARAAQACIALPHQGAVLLSKASAMHKCSSLAGSIRLPDISGLPPYEALVMIAEKRFFFC